MAVVADEAGRLQPVDVVVEVAEPPVEAGRPVVVPLAVEPDAMDGPVARQELGDLVRHEGEVGVVVVRGGAARIVRSPPVQERIVEAEREALLGAGLRELRERVAPERRRVDDVVVRLRGVEHREAVVVARCDRDVARAGALERAGPGAGVEVRRVELRRLRLVVRERHVRLAQVPLALAPDGVDAPVDEDAEAPLRERLAGVDALGRDGRADGAGGEKRKKCGDEKRTERATGVHRNQPCPAVTMAGLHSSYCTPRAGACQIDANRPRRTTDWRLPCRSSASSGSETRLFAPHGASDACDAASSSDSAPDRRPARSRWPETIRKRSCQPPTSGRWRYRAPSRRTDARGPAGTASGRARRRARGSRRPGRRSGNRARPPGGTGCRTCR